MADVFLSYHEQSAGELAERIEDALDAAGISAWFARRDLPFGGNFAREIPSQIHACRLFLLLLTEDVYHSEHIESEVGIAFSRANKKENIIILPLELGDFARKDWAEYYLIHRQSVKFPAQPDERRIERLVNRIAQTLNEKTQPPKASKPQPPPDVAPKTTPPNAPQLSEAQPPPTQADKPPAKIIKRGECGWSVNFTLDENGVLTISGNGHMRDFEWDSNAQAYDTPWWDERETISLVRFQNGATSIGDNAFYDCVRLKNIVIPDSVTKIGWNAFCNCAGLTSVVIPDSVTSIRDYAFSGCAGLTSVVIPDSVTSIRWRAFGGCAELASVVIPDSVKYIGKLAFEGCKNLKNVSVPARAKIENSAFPSWVRVERRA